MSTIRSLWSFRNIATLVAAGLLASSPAATQFTSQEVDGLAAAPDSTPIRLAESWHFWWHASDSASNRRDS